jgi:hypothetical protein
MLFNVIQCYSILFNIFFITTLNNIVIIYKYRFIITRDDYKI